MTEKGRAIRSKVKAVVYVDRPMSTSEVAAYLETTCPAVRRAVRKGELKATRRLKKLFFDPKDVLAFDGVYVA